MKMMNAVSTHRHSPAPRINACPRARWSRAKYRKPMLANGAQDGIVAIFPLEHDPSEEPRVAKLHGGFVSGLAWSPDGRQLLTAAADGFIRQTETAGLRVLNSYTASPNSHPAAVWSL